MAYHARDCPEHRASEPNEACKKAGGEIGYGCGAGAALVAGADRMKLGDVAGLTN
jgi:hypothetical protein